MQSPKDGWEVPGQKKIMKLCRLWNMTIETEQNIYTSEGLKERDNMVLLTI
jgi:hypothetical protein